MTELKNCPCCGSNKIHIGVISTSDLYAFTRIKCEVCSCSITAYPELSAISAWNTRPEDKLEKIKKIIDDVNKRFKDATYRFNMFQDSFVMQELSDIIKDLDKINKVLEGKE